MKKGKGDIKVRYRLSPNEVEQLSKEETARRRKLRLVQVREQAKANAAKIRNDVRKEKWKQMEKLAGEIKNNLEKEKLEKLRRLEKQYENSLKNIGTAHRAARSVKDSQVDRLRKEQRQKEAADERYQIAIKNMRRDRALQDYKEKKQIISRKAALEKETLRAAEIASRPPPPPDPVEEALKTKSKPVPMTDMNAFSTTHYHMPDYAVVKAGPCEQIDAIEAGHEEDERLRQELKERKHLDQDRIIRARIRGNEALRKEHLRHEYSHMLQDLSLLQRADRRRRQEEVAELPKQVFLPPDRRVEEKENKQRDMEKAFEDMYLADKHPTVLMSLDSQAPPDTPSSTQSGDPTLLPDAGTDQQMSAFDGTALKDLTNITTSDQDTKLKQNETALMKLFNRIKQQKEDHATRSAIETSQIGDPSKPPPPAAGNNFVHITQEANGLSPLSEYSALETCSLPSTANQRPSPMATNQIPQQVQIEVKSPGGDKSTQKQGSKVDVSPDVKQTEQERQAWQNKIIQLEEKQKELDSLINKFKHLTGMKEDGHIQSTSVHFHSQPPLMSQGQTAQTSSQFNAVSVVNQGMRDTGFGSLSTGHQSQTPYSGQSEPHPSGIYHAKPVQITEKGGGGKVESGYFSGLPASFSGYHGIGADGIDHSVRHPGLGTRDIASHSLGLAQQADHVKRVREYQEKILKSSQRDLPNRSLSVSQPGLHSRHAYISGASSDSDLAKKVKDYQLKILEGNADRRRFLAETKANIDRQREELYRKYPLTMGTRFDRGAAACSAQGTNSLPLQEESLADKILNEIRDSKRPKDLGMKDSTSQDLVVNKGGDGESLSTSQMSTSSSKARLERIKRSLLFEDPDESLTRTPGRDVSLLAPSEFEEGDLTSSSERGSPNLSKSVRSDGSVGSMSLVTRARETGNVFEKRQLELQKQLEEVQRQKEEILQRYQLGQQKIQDSSSLPRTNLNITGSSYDLSQSKKSNITDPNLHDISFAPLPFEGNLRPVVRPTTVESSSSLLNSTGSNSRPLKPNAADLSVLSDFPQTLEQFSLLDSVRSGQDFTALTAKTDEKSSLGPDRLFADDLEEESLSQVSTNKSPPIQTLDRVIDGSRSVSLSLEEQSLSPESRVTGSDATDTLTWANLLKGVPSVSSEDNGFKTVDFQPTEFIGHDLSTIFEVDTPTTVPRTRESGQFVTLPSASSLDTL